MFFFILRNVEINVIDQKFNWRSYTTIEALSTIKQVTLIEKKKFAAATLDSNDETFVVYIAFFANFNLNIYLFCIAQVVLLI